MSCARSGTFYGFICVFFFFFKQKTAYEMRISDWSSDVCSSDLVLEIGGVDLRTVLLGNQQPDLIGEAVDGRVLLGRGPVKEVDQAPAHFLEDRKSVV